MNLLKFCIDKISKAIRAYELNDIILNGGNYVKDNFQSKIRKQHENSVNAENRLFCIMVQKF
ncbi:hypothetical protein SAMN03097699_0938 [Flavobacteriaceae bacterium MAR_2010_188]|nr:hypothetical protein SAMN03097699_0938 [Flavobacteriaceae bacterium MAR_2010_188]